MPIGLYVIKQGMPKRGDLLLIRLPSEMQAVAVYLGIVSPNTPVMKPVVAVAGDLVCRFGKVVTVNGRVAAIAREFGRCRRRLPIWQGCRRLSSSQVFILAQHPDSFDSRYLGALPVHLALGIAHALLTFPNALSESRCISDTAD